jgi:glycosyltransferase involved in cell wall biosynthesis
MHRQSEESRTASLTLFEFGAWGHLPFYIRLIFEAWRNHGVGHLQAIVTKRFVEEHPFVFEGFDSGPEQPIRWVTLDYADESHLYTLKAAAEAATKIPINEFAGTQERSPRQKGFFLFTWDLIEKYCRLFPSRHILLMNLDEYLFPISAGRRAPADFSGILFRPEFFYAPAGSFRRRVFHAFQEKLVVRSLNHSQLRIAFVLDPWVAESLQGKGTAQVFCLKEPVTIPRCVPSEAERAEIRSRLGLPLDRRVFLLLGDISARKGIWKLVESASGLAPEDAARCCVAIVGRADEKLERRLEARIDDITASRPIEVVRRNAYVGEAELGDWFIAADVVLAPYIHHIGPSGSLLYAAAHRKPVISTGLGAMGKLVREYRLGMTVNSKSADELRCAMTSFIGGASPLGWEPNTAYRFAEDRSHDKFGGRLIDALRPFLD